MGASVSAVLGDIVMENLEIEVLRTIPYLILYYKRFKDDLFLCVRQDEVQLITDYFNDYNPDLQFTLEEEVDNKLNYMDMTLVRSNNVITCKWYQKPTASGRYVNFLSVQPYLYKKNVALNLAHRIVRLTNVTYRREVVEKGKNLLSENCYPESLINAAFKRAIYNVGRNTYTTVRRKIDPSKVISIPYVPLLSENIASFLRKFGFEVVQKNYNTLQCLISQVKAPTPPLNESGVVYKIKCSECDVIYIGMTRQLLKMRLNGHQYDRKEKTALHAHQEATGHVFDFKNVAILDREKNDFKRSLLEMIHILRNKEHTCNFRADIDKLSVVYHPFFQRDLSTFGPPGNQP